MSPAIIESEPSNFLSPIVPPKKVLEPSELVGGIPSAAPSLAVIEEGDEKKGKENDEEMEKKKKKKEEEEEEEDLGEWVLDHYRKRVPALIDDDAFARILAVLEKFTQFNLDHFRDPYLMREGKLLRARLTPKVLKLVGKVSTYNERGEVVVKEKKNKGKGGDKEEGEEESDDKDDKDEAEKEEQGKVVGATEICKVGVDSEPGDKHVVVDGKEEGHLDKPAPIGTDANGHEEVEEEEEAEKGEEEEEDLTPEEIQSLVASYEALGTELDDLLAEEELLDDENNDHKILEEGLEARLRALGLGKEEAILAVREVEKRREAERKEVERKLAERLKLDEAK